MQDARSLKRIGRCETRTMGPAARPVTIAARRMTIVYVLIVSTFEPLLKVIIALCKHIFHKTEGKIYSFLKKSYLSIHYHLLHTLKHIRMTF